ncbi:MAG: hypothetical protein QY314_02465 [Candidatus Dojkabacteria bacterium]|nr:MAG: hypothetical protein QY314_02465 [Candidatus Dojkabacteria bacterium]
MPNPDYDENPQPSQETEPQKVTTKDAMEHVDREYRRPGQDIYGDAFLPHAVVHAFEGPAIIVIEPYQAAAPVLSSPKLLLGVNDAEAEPTYAKKYVKGIPVKQYTPFPQAEIEGLREEEAQESLRDIPDRERRMNKIIREQNIEKFEKALERRRKAIKPETCEILTEAYEERLQICKDFQERLYQEVLDEMTVAPRVEKLFRVVHLLSAAEKRTMVLGTPPEYFLRSAAESKVSKYRPVAKKKPEGSGNPEDEASPQFDPNTQEEPQEFREKEPHEYEKEIGTAMLRLENFVEIPIQGVESADPREVLIQACEETMEYLVKDILHQIGPQCNIVGLRDTDSPQFDTFGRDFAIAKQINGLSVKINRENGRIELFNEDGEQIFLSFLPGIPHEKNIFNVLRMAHMSAARDMQFDYEFEKVGVQITLAQKMADTIQNVHRVLTTIPKKEQNRTHIALQRAVKIVAPYRKNLKHLYEPYLIETEITPDNIDEVAYMAGYLELVRRGANDYPGYDDRFNPIRRKLGEIPAQGEIGIPFGNEPGEIAYLTNNQIEASNLPPEFFERMSQVPHLAVKVHEGWPPHFIESHTRVHKKPRKPDNPEPQLNGMNRYTVYSASPITTTGQSYIGIVHGHMAVPVEVIITIEGEPPERIRIPREQIKRAEDGTYYAPVTEQMKNRANVSYAVTMESAQEMLSEEETNITDPRGIKALRDFIQKLRDTDPNLETLAKELENAIVIRKSDGAEMIPLYMLARAVANSSRYSVDGTRNIVSLDDPVPDLPSLIDPRNGMLKVQCNLSNQIVAHIVGQVLAHDPDVGIYVASGHSVSMSEKQGDLYAVSKAQSHAIVKVIKHGKSVYLDGVPHFLAQGSRAMNFYLPSHVREQVYGEEFDRRLAEEESIEVQDMVILPPERTVWDNNEAIREVEQREETPSVIDFNEVQRQMNREAIERIQVSRNTFFEVLDEKLGGYLSRRQPSTHSQVKLDVLWRQSTQPGTPLQRIMSATSRFSSGAISSGEFYEELRKIEKQLDQITNEATLLRLRQGNGIGLNDPQVHPEIFFAIQRLLEESKASIEQ